MFHLSLVVPRFYVCLCHCCLYSGSGYPFPLIKTKILTKKFKDILKLKTPVYKTLGMCFWCPLQSEFELKFWGNLALNMWAFFSLATMLLTMRNVWGRICVLAECDILAGSLGLQRCSVRSTGHFSGFLANQAGRNNGPYGLLWCIFTF